MYCHCFLSDALVPSSLETFSTCVDKDDKDIQVDEEKSAVTSQRCNVNQEKKVVIKLDDSDIEENRGEINSKSMYSGGSKTEVGKQNIT